VTWAILLPVLIGMLGLGTETGTWYLTKRKLQSAADAAAIAGAYETTSGARTTSATSSVYSNGFPSGSGVTITVNNPPLSGTYTANNNAVEVIVSQSQTTLFASVFMTSHPTITARAVALGTSTATGNACILALSSTGTGINMNGSTVNQPNCVVASDSTTSTSISMNGSHLTALSYYSMGTLFANGSTVTTTNSNTPSATTPIPDPYTSVAAPTPGVCPAANNAAVIMSTTTLNPGTYCNGITLNGAHVTLNPGIYIMDRGNFNVNGSTLTGTGVTIALTSSTGSNYANFTLNGSTMNISAPTAASGDATAGIAIYQDRRATVGNSDVINGSGSSITGALYFPKGALTFNGAGSSGTPSCMQIIANTMLLNGTGYLTNTCAGSGMAAISTGSGVMTVALKE
jgi:Flp pilus assembly protein TadG